EHRAAVVDLHHLQRGVLQQGLRHLLAQVGDRREQQLRLLHPGPAQRRPQPRRVRLRRGLVRRRGPGPLLHPADLRQRPVRGLRRRQHRDEPAV
ncbi:MAG: hypothetical protein AVDCRST_MAG41-3570, partial [uncultured Corynebacteriales bacterium]